MKRLVILCVVATLGACGDDPGRTVAGHEETFEAHARKHLDPQYVCPMHPAVVSDEPGNCPICGMRLVKRERGSIEAPGERAQDATVALDAAVIQALGVRTAPVERGALWRRITTVGYISYDNTRLRHIHPRVEGWIENLRLHQAGERVAEGELLFELYSPALVTAQEEFLGALRSGNAQLITASRDRLRSLDMSERDVTRLERDRQVMKKVPYYAARDEVVTELNVREGMFVGPDMEVMTLADISTVWLRADIFDRQASWVSEGQPAEARLSFLPGHTFEGEVEFVSPVLDPATRTVEARLSFPNPDGRLKPNMFADVIIYGGPKRNILFVPREALIRTPDGGRLVMALGEGRFTTRAVTPGMESGEYVEIVAGAEEGEQVVTSAQFLIDSESSLKAGLGRIDSGAHRHD